MEMKPLKLGRKGQLGMQTVKAVAIAFLVLSVIAVATILALVSLRDSGIFTAASQEANDTSNIVSNVSAGLLTFFASTGTIFAILIVVVIILAIAIVIAVVSRFGGGGGGTTGL